MRKAFKFYRSYYDIMLEVPEKEQLSFLKAIFEKQFFGKEPNLKGMANFAYVSQKHSIESQVKGYEDKTGEKIYCKQPPTQPPAKQLEEKEEVKEKEQGVVSKKCFFKDSDIGNSRENFKAAFPDWNKAKLLHYWNSADSYSTEGNKYIDWKKAINNWASRDEKIGKLKFEEKEMSVEERITNGELRAMGAFNKKKT